jgi:hypothetical protein
VEKLEKQKEEAKDDKQKKEIDVEVSLKILERDLANAKNVREISWHDMPTNTQVLKVLT